MADTITQGDGTVVQVIAPSGFAPPVAAYVKGALSTTVAKGAGPVNSTPVLVGATATLIFAADDAKVARHISNQSGATIYLGPAGVTTTTGFAVLNGEGYDASLLSGELYGVAAAPVTVGKIQY